MGETDFTVRRRPVLSASIVKTSRVKDRSYSRFIDLSLCVRARFSSTGDNPRVGL